MATVESRAKVLGHPLHQMMIFLPLGMFVGAAIFDALYYFGDRDPQWAVVSYWMIVVGLVSGVAAAVPGWIDWTGIPRGTRAKAVGLWHGLGNTVGVIGLFGASWVLRRPTPAAPPDLALLLSALGFLTGGLTAWLGGELVDRLGIGVDPGANPNAPNSLSGRPASAPHGGAA